MGQLILRDILVVFLMAVPVVLVLQWFRLPALVGFILTGALIGPWGIGLIQDPQRIETLAEIGVTLLLFAAGVEFSFASFARFKTYVLKGGLLQIGGCLLAGFLIGEVMGGTPFRSLYFGSLMALSSTAVVLASMEAHRLHESLPGRIATGILILQDLAVIPMMVFLPSLGGGATWRASIVWDVGRVLLLLTLVFLFLKYLAPPIFGRVSRTRSRELFLVTVVTFALGMAWLTHRMGLSFALGAFLGGLLVGGTDYRVQALSELTPFRYCFNSLFFVSIGMLLNFPFLREHLFAVVALVFLIPVLKVLITAGVLVLLKAPLRVSLNTGILLGQIGEFSFLLAIVGRQSGVLDPYLYEMVLAVAAVTMWFTPLAVRWSLPVAERIARLPGLKRLSSVGDLEFLERADPLSGHVIVCGFGPLGEALGHLLEEHRIPHLVLELNPETIRRVRETKRPVYFGDGASEEILYKSGIERARMLAITTPDFFNNVAIVQQARRLNAEIRIVTRAKYRNEVSDLYGAGADVVVSEELEGGIEMGRYALRELGVVPEEVDTYIQKIREFGSADFF